MKLCLFRPLSLLVISAPRLVATEPQPVIIDYRVYTAPQEIALPWMEELHGSDASAVFRRLNEFTTAGKIRLAAITKLHGVNGVQTTQWGNDESRYPVEWAQPMIPGFTIFGFVPTPKSTGDFIAPTTIETRDLGLRVEVTAEVSRDDRQATLACNTRLTRLDGWFRTPATFTVGGLAISLPQPRFASSGVNARVTVPLERWTLLSAQTDAKNPGHILLHTIRATVPGSDRAPAKRQL